MLEETEERDGYTKGDRLPPKSALTLDRQLLGRQSTNQAPQFITYLPIITSSIIHRLYRASPSPLANPARAVSERWRLSRHPKVHIFFHGSNDISGLTKREPRLIWDDFYCVSVALHTMYIR